ncbi:putative integral membrane protein (TIGR02327 family) [Enterococcus sp. PF1-24]|uniref:DUF1146 family protein n=1 Tax=unclassified Enterococcus TaxID=2608891 RepID=UPI002475C440|nr:MULTISPECIES: DUF1146 family protein [unclassified Enterococcus]MDH6365439.1 putative integral membrane protein (TIGR02327 family) [Enterococcus sp. PFB1-1]MDH6402540.1 putative integral membrane protein (TIGR02327 family) [Enterococcus sp. PF1-24]
MQFYGVDAFLRVFSHLAFIYLAFWSLQALRLEQFFKRDETARIRMILMLLAIVIGYQASSFFLEFLAICRNLFMQSSF